MFRYFKGVVLGLISFLLSDRSSNRLYILLHILGLLSIGFYLAGYFYDDLKRVGLSFIYLVIVLIFFIRPSMVLSIRQVTLYGYLFRFIVLLFFILSTDSFSLVKSDWTGFLLKDFYYYSPVFYILPLFLDIITLYFLKLILYKYGFSLGFMVLYIWNPFIIEGLYGTWDPFTIWIVFILLVFVLILYDRRFLGSIVLGLSMGLHGLSFLVIFSLVRRLKGYLLISLFIFLCLLLIPGHIDYLLSGILYSEWLQGIFSFFRGLGFIYNLDNYKVIVLLSLLLSMLFWSVISSIDALNKVHISIFIFILAYPFVFVDVAILVIVLSVIFRNTALLVFSVYIYCLPALNSTFVYSGYLSYIILISFSFAMLLRYFYDKRRNV